jgi:O-antigen/teichoic acid export membrane protein
MAQASAALAAGSHDVDVHLPSVEEPRASAQGRVAGNTVARAAGEAVAKLGSLAFYVVMARELGHADYGAFVFALALTGTLLIASGFGTDELIARQVARDHSRAGPDLADVALLKGAMSAILLAVAVGIVVVGGYPAETQIATVIVGLGAAAEVMAKSWHAVFQGRERLELVSACLILQRLLTASVGIALLLSGAGLVAAAFAYLGGALVALAAAELALRRHTPAARPPPRWAGAQRLLRDGLPIGVAGLLFILILKTDVLLLSFLDSNAAVGLYAAAFRLIEGTQFLAWSFDAAMLPWLARTRGPSLVRGYGLGLKLEAGLLLPIALVVACFAGPIVRLLYGDGYAGSITPLTLLAPTIVLYGLQSLSATLLIARDAPGVFARVAAVVAVQNVVCNAVAIPLAGPSGAAAVALSSSVLLTVLNVRQARRRAGGLQTARAFAGPLAAAAVFLPVAMLVPGPPVTAAVAALIAYAAVLLGVELGRHRDDVAVYLDALPAALRVRISAAASRFRRGQAPA